MKRSNPRWIRSTQILLILVLVQGSLFNGGCAETTAKTNVDPKPGNSDGMIQVEFKLDPRITGALYMGERWVSPPSYDTVQPGAIFAVEARAQLLDVDGRPQQSDIEWIPSDPALIVITPGQGSQVMIQVQGAGETSVQVISQGVAKTLAITATYQENAIRVKITQSDDDIAG